MVVKCMAVSVAISYKKALKGQLPPKDSKKNGGFRK